MFILKHQKVDVLDPAHGPHNIAPYPCKGYIGKCCVIPFVKKMPAIEHLEALVLMFETVKSP